MQVFYAPGISGDRYTLDEKESAHCIRVLRMKKGSPVTIIDGKGNLYESEIEVADQKCCVIRVNKVIPGFGKRTYSLHIAISPLKNPERFEWFVEKCVEIGVDEITPLICDKTEKLSIKEERIKNIIVSAMKQSLKGYETILNDKVKFGAFIKHSHAGKRLIAHCSSGFERANIGKLVVPGEKVTILIGPEGDFSDQEIAEAYKAGFSGTDLGESRLRTETAGIAACHSIYLINSLAKAT